MITNRVSVSVSSIVLQTVMAAIATIRENLPFLVDLTSSERSSLPKLGDFSQAFTSEAFVIALQHPDFFPQNFLEEMKKDSELLAILRPIRVAIDQLAKQIDDTTMQVGAEYFAAARTVYATSKTPFAKAVLRTASEGLGKRYSRKPKTGATAEPQTPEQPPDSPKKTVS